MPKLINISVRDIDRDKWIKFKIRCIQEGKTLAQGINELIAKAAK